MLTFIVFPQASSKKSRSMVSSPTFSRNFLIDFSSSSLFPDKFSKNKIFRFQSLTILLLPRSLWSPSS